MADVDLSALQDAVGQLIAAAAGASPSIGLDTVTAVMAARDREADYPYIVFGPEEVFDQATECGDAVRVFLPLDVWTKEQGRTRCKAICDGLRGLFNGNLFAVPDHAVSLCWHRRTLIFDDPELGVRHGRVEFDIDIASAA